MPPIRGCSTNDIGTVQLSERLCQALDLQKRRQIFKNMTQVIHQLIDQHFDITLPSSEQQTNMEYFVNEYIDFFPGFFNGTYSNKAERIASLEAYAASRIDEGLLELSGNAKKPITIKVKRPRPPTPPSPGSSSEERSPSPEFTLPDDPMTEIGASPSPSPEGSPPEFTLPDDPMTEIDSIMDLATHDSPSRAPPPEFSLSTDPTAEEATPISSSSPARSPLPEFSLSTDPTAEEATRISPSSSPTRSPSPEVSLSTDSTTEAATRVSPSSSPTRSPLPEVSLATDSTAEEATHISPSSSPTRSPLPEVSLSTKPTTELQTPPSPERSLSPEFTIPSDPIIEFCQNCFPSMVHRVEALKLAGATTKDLLLGMARWSEERLRRFLWDNGIVATPLEETTFFIGFECVLEDSLRPASAMSL